MEYSYEKALDRAFCKIDHMLSYLKGFPHITKDSQWLQNKDGHWTGGFWTGLLWIESIIKNDEAKKAEAAEWALRLHCRMKDTSTHDLGFLFGPSCEFGYRLTGNEKLLPLVEAGCNNLIKQYVPETGLIRAWGESGYEGISIVDTIMNLPIIWVHSVRTGNEEGKAFTLNVARNIQKYAIREDGSSFHVVKWDKEYHISGGTHQGFSDTSCWSRGQSWALYGFANMYRYTGEAEFLATAEQVAEYFWSHLNREHLPAWDFVFQNEDVPLDASAASIAASGMELMASIYRTKGETEKATLWSARSDAILQAECQQCLYRDLDKFGIIEKVTVDFPRRSGVNESSMYGDYYFVEALFRKKYCNDPEMLALLY